MIGKINNQRCPNPDAILFSERTVPVARDPAKIIPLIRPEHKEGKNEAAAPNRKFEDAELVSRAKKDDTTAITELIERYQQKAYAVAYQMCDRDEDDAHDLTQEALLRAFRSLKKFKGKSSFYTWLYRIVVNTCLDARKRRWRKQKFFFRRHSINPDDQQPDDPLEKLPDTGSDADPLKVLSGKELYRRVQESLGALPEKQRLAFHLKVNQDMSIREIAQVMGSAEGTVKSHLFRAIRFMRKALKDWT